MPNQSSVIGTWLTMDVQDFVTGAHEAREALQGLKREFEASSDGGRRWEKSIQGVEHRIDYLNKKIEVQRQVQKIYNDQLVKLRQNEEENASAIQSKLEGIDNAQIQINNYTRQLERCNTILERLKKQEEEANSALGRLRATIAQQEKDLAELIVQWKNVVLQYGKSSDESKDLEARITTLNAELRENRNTLAQIDGSADALTDSVNRMGRGFTVLKGVLANLATDALYRLFDTMRNAFDAAVQWESSFTGVTRTVEGSPEQMQALEQSLFGIGRTVATPMSEVADIAALAGQMGIAVDDISEFTRVMIMLGDTTNISAEEAGDSLARLSNLLNVTSDDYQRMASVLVDLGNKFPTTESEIASMASRLGGTANMLGIATQDVFGLANAISALGLEAEMGGNAISKTLREMQLAVENGTDRLTVFANTAGLTAEEFQRVFAEDSIEALRLFVAGLGDVARNGRSTTQILNEVNVTELRQVDVLTRMASNVDVLNDSLAVARQAWEDNTALISEASERYNTLESRIQMMNNSWTTVAVLLGKTVEPAIKGVVDWVSSLGRFLAGQRGASEELQISMINLRNAVNEYKSAQDIAAESTNGLTKAMEAQRFEAMRLAMTDFIDVFNNSQSEIETYRGTVANARENVVTAYRDRYSGVSTYANALLEDGIDINNLSADDIINLYGQLDELRVKAQETRTYYNEGILGFGAGWVTEPTELSLGYKELVAVIEQLYPQIDNLRQAMDDSDASISRVRLNQAGMLEQYYEMYDMLDAEGNHVADAAMFPNLTDEAREMFKVVEEGWDNSNRVLQNGYLESLGLTQDTAVAMYQSLNDMQSGMDSLADSNYWGIQRAKDALVDYGKSQGWNILPRGQGGGGGSEILAGEASAPTTSVAQIMDEFVRNRRMENTISAGLGIVVDESAVRNSLESVYRQLVEYEYELSDLTKSANEELATTNNEARKTELNAQIGYYNDEIAAAQEARANLEKIYGKPIPQGWFAGSEASETPEANRYQIRYDELFQIEAGLDSLSEEMQDYAKSRIKSSAQSLILDLMGIPKEGLSEADIGRIEEYIGNLQDLIDRNSTDTEEDADTGNWWTNFKDNLANEDTAAFGAGLQSMVQDLTGLWNQLGQGILDTINMWFDAQIEAIDNAIEHLEESLDREQELLDYQANRQQAMLNKQLEEGLITEEQYNEASRLNKEHTEAAKYEAEIEGQNKLEELNIQRDEIERRQFEAEKANSIAQVWISAAQGIAAAWASGNPIAAGVITGLITAMAGVQTGIIASQQYVTALAKGGIVDSPTTALIGEAGREAVIPLENNTEWIDKLARDIVYAMGSDSIATAIERATDRVSSSTSNVNNNQQFTQIINSPKALSRIEIYRDTRRLFKQFGRN